MVTIYFLKMSGSLVFSSWGFFSSFTDNDQAEAFISHSRQLMKKFSYSREWRHSEVKSNILFNFECLDVHSFNLII